MILFKDPIAFRIKIMWNQIVVIKIRMQDKLLPRILFLTNPILFYFFVGNLNTRLKTLAILYGHFLSDRSSELKIIYLK